MADIKKMLDILWENGILIQYTLKSIWLNQNEINIYLNSLCIWPNTSSVLWKQVWLKRSTSQYTCQSLVNKKLMNMIQKANTYVFSAEDPEKLLYILNKNILDINKQKNFVQKIMWDLKNFGNSFWNIPKIKYYQWGDELINLVDDIFKENKTIYWVLKLFDEAKWVNSFIEKEYIPKRVKSWMYAKMIFNDNDITQKYREYDKKMNRYSLLVPDEIFPFDSCMHIYGNKVVFYSFLNNDFVWILIENKSIRNTMFSLFKIAWEQARNYNINERYKDIEL